MWFCYCSRDTWQATDVLFVVWYCTWITRAGYYETGLVNEMDMLMKLFVKDLDDCPVASGEIASEHDGCFDRV